MVVGAAVPATGVCKHCAWGTAEWRLEWAAGRRACQGISGYFFCLRFFFWTSLIFGFIDFIKFGNFISSNILVPLPASPLEFLITCLSGHSKLSYSSLILCPFNFFFCVFRFGYFLLVYLQVQCFIFSCSIQSTMNFIWCIFISGAIVFIYRSLIWDISVSWRSMLSSTFLNIWDRVTRTF